MTTNATDGERALPSNAGLPDSPDPVEVAMAAAADDPAGQQIVRSMLMKQDRLFDAQILQLGRQRWRDGFFALLCAGVVLAAATFLWSAWRADGIVLAPFGVPPALAERGITGTVVASQILDRLTAMQAETSSIRPASSYGDDWSGNIKVELPYAGISIGELRRYLVSAIGKQRTLSGEVVSLANGRVALTTRISGLPGKRYEGAGLDALVQQAAEGVYKDTQAYRFGYWLIRNERHDEASQTFQELSRSNDPVERMWSLLALGIYEPDLRRALALFNKVQAIDPSFPAAAANAAAVQAQLGHNEAACQSARSAVVKYDAWRGRLTAGRLEGDKLGLQSMVANCYGDYVAAAAAMSRSSEYEADYTNSLLAPLLLAWSYGEYHDVAAARAVVSDAGLNDPAKLKPLLARVGLEQDPEIAFAYANRDWPGLRDNLTRVFAAPAGRNRDNVAAQGILRAMLAEAFARTGRYSEAVALVTAMPLDCDYCLRVRGLAAAFAGRPAEADHWLGQLARRTPSLPMAHEAWAEAKLMHRDYSGAAREAATAHALGPRWAEPLKHWGDALAAQGKWSEAAAKYALALERAPNWAALRQAHVGAVRQGTKSLSLG